MAASLEQYQNDPGRVDAVLRRGIAAVGSSRELKLQLVETLIDRGGESVTEAESLLETLGRLGLAEGYLRYQGRIALARQAWANATSRLELARTLLAGDSAMLGRINMLLSVCYGQQGEEKQRLAAIERAAADPAAAVAVGPVLAQALEAQGRVDDAIQFHTQLRQTRPQSRLDLVRLLIQKTVQLPAPRRTGTGPSRG